MATAHTVEERPEVDRIFAQGDITDSQVRDVGTADVRQRLLDDAVSQTSDETRRAGCVIPGYRTPPARCHVHHLRTWRDGGRTDVAAMALVCHDHHIWLHEGGRTLGRGPDGTWSIRAP